MSWHAFDVVGKEYKMVATDGKYSYGIYLRVWMDIVALWYSLFFMLFEFLRKVHQGLLNVVRGSEALLEFFE